MDGKYWHSALQGDVARTRAALEESGARAVLVRRSEELALLRFSNSWRRIDNYIQSAAFIRHF